ncbi:Putative cytoplasmic protein [Salmonella bongori]|nr:Putative cytoplasmic protein [Salmonella bongori]
MVWDRKRAAQLFAFNYRLECYTPAPKRQYGYFVLPLLHRGRLVGRMDAKMHRKTGVLEVISLYLEDDIRPDASLQKGIRQAISEFCRLATGITCHVGTMSGRSV